MNTYPMHKLGLRILLVCLIACSAVRALAVGEPAQGQGSVCFVSYTPKVAAPVLDNQAVIFVDDLPPQPLVGHNPRLLATTLDLSKSHQVKVSMQDQTWFSQRFTFKPGTTMVHVWRSAGYWHLEPNPSGECKPFAEQPLPQDQPSSL